MNWKHGHRHKSTYNVWVGMKARTLNPQDPSYANYGGRGITIDPRWNEFVNFLSDMGERPSGMQIERKDNDGNYTKDNCIWASRKQQCRNRRSNHLLTLNGLTKPMIEWCEEFGMSYTMVHARIYAYGWTVEKALTTPRTRTPRSMAFAVSNGVELIETEHGGFYERTRE